MKLQNLKYFEKLIELKNYSSVADYFSVKQPTVSLGIKRLEEDVGYNLIVHNTQNKRFLLTKEGESFHNYSKEVINKLDLLENEITCNLKKSNINFGIPPMIKQTYFSKIAKNLDVESLSHINIIEDNSNDLIKMLLKDEIDIAIVASTKEIKLNGLYSRVLTNDKFKVVVSKNNPLAQQNEISCADVDSSKIILMGIGYIQSKIFNKIKEERFSNPHVIYQTSDFNIIKKMIKENVGISFFLSKSINPEDGIVAINPKTNEIPMIYISLVYCEKCKLIKSEKKLIDAVSASFKN